MIKSKNGLFVVIQIAAFVAVPASADQVDINETTSRDLRTKTMCRVAVEPDLKPSLNDWDNIRITPTNFAYADLYGDGTVDLVAGFSDEAYRVNPKYGLQEYYEGNEQRSRQPFQYSFYSPDPAFIVPDGTKFNLARTIVVQDFNADGIEDMVFVQTGVDFAPYTPWRNEIMLSSGSGYSVSYLPGPRSKYHGGAAGDIDNDGDIDIVVSPSANNSIVAYINDGNGSFRYTEVVQRHPRNYAANAFLWDVDGDEKLDLIASLQGNGVHIHWGRGDGRFANKPVEVMLGKNRLNVQDVEFGDFDGNGEQEILFLSSEGLTPNDKTPYSGWSIKSASFDGRELVNVTTIDGVLASEAGFYWLARFSACDLKNDGTLDLVYEHHGEQSPFYSIEKTGTLDNDLSRADKLVWLNDGNGRFDRFRIESPFFFADEFSNAIEEMAQRVGVTTARYQAPQTYFPNDEGLNVSIYAWRNTQPYPLRKLNDGTVLEELAYNVCGTKEGRPVPENVCDFYSIPSTLIRMQAEIQLPIDELPEVKRYCWDTSKNIELYSTENGSC